MKFGRIIDDFVAAVLACDPRRRYRALYFGKVVQWDATTQQVDVIPDDPSFPPMGGLPFFHGLPGTVATVAPGTRVLFGWSGGDRRAPFAGLWSGGENVLSLVLNGEIILGGTSDAEPPVKGSTYRTSEDAYFAALEAFVAAAASAAPTEAAAFAAAATTFHAGAAGYLATNVLVE